MTSVRFTLLALLLVPAAGMAHQINGTVRFPNGQPFQGDVGIRCPSEQDQKRTDRYGNFSFFIRNTGRCTLNLGGASYPVYSSQNPVRYDLILDRGVLRRR